jgi:hypothetical protein
MFPRTSSLSFLADRRAVVTYEGRPIGRDAIVRTIADNDYSGAVEVARVGGRPYANLFGPDGRRRVLMPIEAPAPGPRKPRRTKEDPNSPCVTIKPAGR